MKQIAAILSTIIVLSSVALANNAQRVTIIGKKASTVVGNVITLNDLTTIEAKNISDDDSVLKLQKIPLQNSPEPGESVTLSAARVIDVLKRAGVNLEQIGYSFPRIMTVTRASRTLEVSEVIDAIKRKFDENSRDIIVRDVTYKGEQKIAPGLAQISVTQLSQVKGNAQFQIRVSVPGARVAQFTTTAYLEEWTDVPVATRELRRGAIVGTRDITMARLNMQALPTDINLEPQELVGLEVEKHMTSGEVFRRKSLRIPPVVTIGSKVVISYNKGSLQATASGAALEDGIQDQSIRVKNTGSGRTLVATVVEPGLVRVE